VGWAAGGVIGLPLPAAPIATGAPEPPRGEPLPITAGDPAVLLTAAEPATLPEPAVAVSGALSDAESEHPASARHASKQTND
jgi:hypothetical protein